MAPELLDGAGRHLALQGLVGADEQLLARLAAGVEGARDLYFVVGYLLVLFACLLATDNKRNPQGITDIDAAAIINIVLIPVLSAK